MTVTFTADGTLKWSFSGGNGGYDSSEGIYKITIVNNSGNMLPGTGGIGTTIFYILGGLLVVGAAQSEGIIPLRRGEISRRASLARDDTDPMG